MLGIFIEHIKIVHALSPFLPKLPKQRCLKYADFQKQAAIERQAFRRGKCADDMDAMFSYKIESAGFSRYFYIVTVEV